MFCPSFILLSFVLTTTPLVFFYDLKECIFRENLYCIVSVKIFTVSNTTVLILSVLFGSEQTIPLVFLFHMFLMKVAVVRITITYRALYKLLHSKIKSGVVSKPHFGIKLLSAKSTS